MRTLLLLLAVAASACSTATVRPSRPETPRAPAAPAPAPGFAAPGAPRAGKVDAPDGVPIAFTEAGSGSPALVFVHGWSSDRSSWAAQLRTFAPAHRVLALDLPGHGESGRTRREWTIRGYGADVARVLDALDLREVVLVGHSMGGPVALEAAALAPSRVVAVIGVDTLHNVSQEHGPEFAALADAMERDFPGTCGPFVGSMFGSAAKPELVASVQRRMCSAPPEVAVPLLRDALAWDAVRAIEAVKAPIRCIQGDRFPTNVEGNRRHHADFDVVVVPGTGHFPQLEMPEAFDRALAEIVRSVR
jgi:sigma-B regulation protein RsbQ